MFRKSAVFLIKIYQRTLSFDHGPFKVLFPGGYCQYNPTCSQYTLEAIERYGLIKGGFMGTWRIMRCNPWSKGGNDPVPEQNACNHKH